MKNLIFLIFLLSMMGCAHSIMNVHATSFDNTPGRQDPRLIESRSEQHVVLGFAYDSNYVEEAHILLQTQCPGGTIEGITSQFSTSLGFLSWKNKILMRGFCYQ